MKQFEIVRGAKPAPLSRYPFEKMQIGDAFYVPCPRELRNNEQTKIHNAARRFREKHKANFRISTRATLHKGGFAIAVFRTH